MTANKLKYTVEVDTTQNPPELKLIYKGKVLDPTVPIIFNKNKDDMYKVDHYRLKFDIKSFGSSPLRFTSKLDDVLWVKTGTNVGTCPTSRCQDLPNTFWVDDADPDGEWIEIVNMDMKPVDFWFTLNLVYKNDPNSTNYVPLDPGGGNQNGGKLGSSSPINYLVPLAAGFGAGLVASFGVKLLLGG